MQEKLNAVGMQSLLIMSLTFLLPAFSTAQVKFEKESRISRDDVPEIAFLMLDELNLDVRVRWFMEESERGYSYEGKYKLNRVWHSIEFDSTGQFQDAEIEIKEKELPEGTRRRMHADFSAEFDRYRIRKIQRQLSGPREEVLSALDTQALPPAIRVRYEIVVKGKASGETHLYEYLFSRTGEPERKARIILRNTDHLIF